MPKPEKEKNPAAVALGKLGGAKTKKRIEEGSLPKDHYEQIGKKGGALSRKPKPADVPLLDFNDNSHMFT